MNIYSVYIDSSKKVTSPILIEQKFSFIPLIFNIFWALYHKMWSVIIVAFVTIVFSRMLHAYQIIDITYPATISILGIFTLFAVEMREHYMIKRGFRLDDIILALSEDEAEIKYYSKNYQI